MLVSSDRDRPHTAPRVLLLVVRGFADHSPPIKYVHTASSIYTDSVTRFYPEDSILFDHLQQVVNCDCN